MSPPQKREAGDDNSTPQPKRQKARWAKQLNAARKGTTGSKYTTIGTGDSGIFSTCTRGKEKKGETELLELLDTYVKKLYPSASSDAGDAEDNSDRDIEADLHKELSQLQAPQDVALLEPVKIDMECVVFCKIKPPLEATTLVHAICKDAQQRRQAHNSRFLQRLTPVTMIGKATEVGLDKVAQTVLTPYFHGDAQKPKKFAIRPTIRNHDILTRDTVINQVARIVGTGHSVDLKNYDLLILVDVWENMCGMAVVSHDFEELKRYNLGVLYEPGAARPPHEKASEHVPES